MTIQEIKQNSKPKRPRRTKSSSSQGKVKNETKELLDLEPKITEIQERIYKEAHLKDLDAFIDSIRKLKRAIRGESLEEDAFNQLINVADIKERTRIKKRDIRVHTYLRMLAKEGGESFNICKEVADMLDTYAIAEDGEQRREAILMIRQKLAAQQPQNINIGTYPEVNTQIEKPKKPHFWSRTQGEGGISA